MEFTAQQPSEADGVDSSTDPGTTATATQWWMSAVDTNSPTFWFTVVLGLMMLGALPYIYDSFVHPCLLRFGIIRENVAGAAVPFSQAERQRHRALKSIEAKHAEAVAVQREKIAQKAKAEADRLNELLHPTPAGIGKGVAVGKGDGEIARLASRVKAGDAAGAAALARAAQLPRTTPGRTSPLPDAPTAAELQGGTAAASAAAMFAARDQDRNLIDDQEREYQEAMAMDAAMAVSDRAAAAHDAAAVAAAATLPKRLTADELHQRRRQVAEARLPAEPAENEDDDVLHLVIRCMDWRGDTKVMRRFRKADRVSVVMDFVQVGIRLLTETRGERRLCSGSRASAVIMLFAVLIATPVESLNNLVLASTLHVDHHQSIASLLAQQLVPSA